MPWSFEEDVESYAASSVEALELCEVKIDDDRVGEQLDSVAAAGPLIPSVQPAPYAPGAAFVTG